MAIIIGNSSSLSIETDAGGYNVSIDFYSLEEINEFMSEFIKVANNTFNANISLTIPDLSKNICFPPEGEPMPMHRVQIVCITDFNHGDSSTTIYAQCKRCGARSKEFEQIGFPATSQVMRVAQHDLNNQDEPTT